MMSTTRREELLISPMVATTWSTTEPPRSATEQAPEAIWLACWAFSAFWCTVAVSCSMEAAVSSSELAWRSVRCDRSTLPVAISPAERWMTPAVSWMRVTSWRSCSLMRCTAAITLPSGAWAAPASPDCDRSPEAMRLAISAATAGSPPMALSTLRVASHAIRDSSAPSTASAATDLVMVATKACWMSST
ncbi:MAG: hypothetical protein GAK34_02467 [Delftia tsuruhatensis]|nr:MAG: hypothetical protein GAK34_02467 [Delftia tsuruhatensis]